MRQAPYYAFSKNASLFLISALVDWKLQHGVKKIKGLSNQVLLSSNKQYAYIYEASANRTNQLVSTSIVRNSASCVTRCSFPF